MATRRHPNPGRPPVTNWDEVPLGIDSDEDIARRLGVTRRAVTAQRNKKGIAPASGSPEKAAQDRADAAALDAAVGCLLDGERHPLLSVRTADAVDRVPGWAAETKRGAPPARILFIRFRTARSRTWTEWMKSRPARAWLLQAGWADRAIARLAELRRTATTTKAKEATA